jgi:hypothetical protein
MIAMHYSGEQTVFYVLVIVVPSGGSFFFVKLQPPANLNTNKTRDAAPRPSVP